MAVRKPLITLNGRLQELPAADTVLVPEGRAKAGATTHLWLPDFIVASVGTLALTANRMQYEPVIVRTPVTLDRLTVEVTSLVAATNIQLGIYNADTDWQPTSLVIDGGNVSSAATGVLSVTINLTLQPGRYLNALISNGAPTVRMLRGGITPIDAALGSSPAIKQFRVASTYGALASTGVAWDTTTNGTTPFEHLLFWRVSSP